jgi:prepilin-type N-terminal cleavage/methylation domain-containing protein
LSKNSSNLNFESGVTVVELLVVIIIIAIVASIALMNRGSANEQFKRQNVALELKVAFERARFDSVKRRADTAAVQAKVTVTPTSYTLTIDRNMDGTLTADEDLVASLPAGVVIGLYSGASLSSQEVVFNMRGETSQLPAPQFLVCNVACSSPNNSNSNIVLVTQTGTVNLLNGNSSLPTFANANVSNVNTSTDINNTVSLPNP